MKLNEEFVIIIGSEVFWSDKIINLSMGADGFAMTVVSAHGTRCIKCRLGEVEILKRSKRDKRVVETITTWNCLGESAVCKEIRTPIDEVKDAFIDALKTIKEEQQCNIDIKIDGKEFAKLIKKHNQDRIRSD